MPGERPATADPSPSRWRGFRVRIVAVVGLLFLVLLVVLAGWDVTGSWSWEAFLRWKSQVDALPFFLGMALLPLFGFPATPLFLLAGATFPPAVALGGTAASIFLNLILSHWLANRWLGPFLRRRLKRWNIRWPEHSSSQGLRFVVLVRLTPGPPTFFKNYLTALADVPLRHYLAVSWVATFLYAAGLIVMGDSLVKSSPGEAVVGLAILVVAYVLFEILRRRLGPPGEEKAPPSTDGE